MVGLGRVFFPLHIFLCCLAFLRILSEGMPNSLVLPLQSTPSENIFCDSQRAGGGSEVYWGLETKQGAGGCYLQALFLSSEFRSWLQQAFQPF